MKKIKFIFIVLLWFIEPPLHAAAITNLYVGQTGYLVAPNPPGSNTALFQTAWSSTCAHLKVSKYLTYGAKVTINDYFTETAEVRCDYYYYWYDNNGRQFTNSATTYFYVNCVPVTVTVSPMQLNIGEGKYLNYSYSPSNVSPAPTIRFTSSNSNIVTVNDNGYVSAVSAGSATITLLNSSGPKATCSVVVRNTTISPSSIIVSPPSATMEIGDRKAISYTLYPSNASSPITWSSSNTSVATVSTTGIVTAISAGTASVTASTNNGLSASCSITVNDATSTQPTSISLSPTSANLEVGETKNLTYTLTPSNATTTITWSSDNTSVATVNSAGVVTAVSAGSATITAKTSNNKTATCIVSVNAAPVSLTSISIYPSSLTVERGKSFTITATLNPNGATATLRWGTTTDVLTINNGTLVSSSGNAGIYELTNNSLTANVTAVGEGTAVILVVPTKGLIAAQCVVTVVPAASPTSLSLNPTSMTLDVGEYRYINESFYPEGTTADITWSSNNTSVATVNTLGKVTAVSAGHATITATTSNGLSATCAVTVNAASTLPTSISLSPTSMNLTVGEYKYIYESFYPEGSTADITWSSSNTSVAIVNSVGKVTAVSAGSATITAKTSNNKTATCSVTVTAASTQPTSISVSPSSVNLEVGGTKNLTYTLSPSTATTTVTWSSSNTSVATVSSAGKVTAVSAGSATITAKTSNNKTATCAVTVQPSPSAISPTGITIVPSNVYLKVGGSKTLSYLLTPINATTTVTWESDDTSVVTVSSTGYVKAKGEGSATITAITSNNMTASCLIEVFTSSNYTLTYEYNEYTSEAILTGSAGDDPIIGSVTIPSYVTNPDDNKRYKVVGIGDWAFGGEYGITAITLPTTITCIGKSAFESCSSLTSVTIPNSVTSIGDDAFEYCSSLTSVTIGSRVTDIGCWTFSDCISLTSVTIPNSVTYIGNSVFGGCCSLTSVTIPNSVTSIGDCAFCGCSSLTSVTIPNSVTNIGYRAFDSCSSLTSVTIPNSVTNIGNFAFVSCSSLTSINVANGNLDYCSTEGVLFNKAQTRLIQYPAGKSNVTYTIPNSVTSIGFSAFYNCARLTSVTIPNSVTYIGEDAFWNCSGLTSVNISDIAAWCAIRFDSGTANPLCFAHNLYLNDTLVTDLVIPDSVTSIEKYAFYNCRSMSSVSIPNSVTSIGKSAFSRCSSLTSVTNNAITPQSVDASTFYNVNKSACTLYVPKESVDLYNVADEWKDFGNIIGLKIPQGIEDVQGGDTPCTKVLRDGQIFILRGDKTYTVTGQEVK